MRRAGLQPRTRAARGVRAWPGICLVLLGLLLAATAWAEIPERPRLRIIGSSEGLPSTDIFGITRDHAGYVWIATGDGLARYDGVDMRVWRHDPDDPGSLPGNLLYAVHVDHRDRVWLAGQGSGLGVLDADRRTFRSYRKDEYPQIGSDEVFTIASRGDEIWFGSYEGLHRLDAGGRITRFEHDPDDPESLPSNIVLAIAFDGRGTLWIATMAGLARYDDGRITRVPLPGDHPSQSVLSVTPVDDGVWIGATTGLLRIDGDGNLTRPPWAERFRRPNAVVSLAQERDGGLWLGTQRGLWRLSPGAEEPVPVPIGGTAAAVKALLLQEDGALWVPVYGSGLGYLRSDWRRITQLTPASDGLAGDLYRGIAVSAEGGAWIGARNGVLERVGSGGVAGRLPAELVEALDNIGILAVAEAPDGAVWITSSRLGLSRIADGRITSWNPRSESDALPAGTPNMLHFAPDGTLWICVQGYGVQQRDAATGRVLRTLKVGDESDNSWMESSPDGDLWISGRNGMDRLAAGAEGFVAVPEMRGATVYMFAFDGPDVLWLQRMTGLERYERSAGRWRRTDIVGPGEGLPAVHGFGLRIDARHRVWLSSARGLFRWDPDARMLRHYGVRHGLTSQEFIERALVIDRDGILVGATADGSVVLLDTLADDPVQVVPALRLDSVAVRRNGEWRPLEFSGGIVLGAGIQEVRVSGRLLSYDDPLSNHYWTLLEGFDPVWVAHGTSGDRVFSGLRPGRYVLRMRATDASGASSGTVEVPFRVLPPWWLAPWAIVGYVLFALLVAGLATLAYRNRLRRRSEWQLAEHKRELAEQASLAKTRFLATLAHEVRTPMTGVLGMSELLLGTRLDDRQRGYVESIRKAGEHLLRLVNDALDLARIEADRLELDPQPFDLRALVREVEGLCAPVARQRGLDFRVEVAEDAPRWLLGDVTRVRQILLNLLGNANKFTERGSVGLRVEAMPPAGVRMVVSDTGPGISGEQQQRLFRRFEQAEGARTAARYGGSGLGLAICQELAVAMGGRITVQSAVGEGARFIVELPLPRAAPPEGVPEARQATAGGGLPALGILLVEDDATVAEAISGLLAAQGHRVTHVGNGFLALSEAMAGHFDVALFDLDLPGVDGLELVRMLRGQGFGRPVLAVTARADIDAESQARRAGFDGFLRKPVTGGMLADALRAALAARAAAPGD